jgi:hypothetical protein
VSGVEVLPCGHVAARGDSKLCRHLHGEFSVAYVGVLRGAGLECDYRCTACDDADVAELMEACEGCVGRVVDGDGLVGYRGRPGIAERPEPLDPHLVLLPAPVRHLLDMAPVDEVPGRWLLLTPTRVHRWDAATREVCDGVPYTLPEQPGDGSAPGKAPGPRLHAGPGGRHAVVAVDYGRHGVLLDMAAGEVVMRLDRGGYHPEQTRYPVAFVTGGLLAHGTDWNRLDLTDPATGTLVTAREPTSYRHREPLPEHYLDFFHGRLHASPDGRRLLEDGWAWSPVGGVRTWDATAWRDNPWESEDGPSLRHLCWRDSWDVPACWWGPDRAVLWGIGSDEEAMLDGARIFDVDSGEEVGRFPGPAGEFFHDRDRLYAACPDGLEIWDLTTGERTGRIPDFVPRWFRRRDRVLTARHGDWLSCWRLPG